MAWKFEDNYTAALKTDPITGLVFLMITEKVSNKQYSLKIDAPAYYNLKSSYIMTPKLCRDLSNYLKANGREIIESYRENSYGFLPIQSLVSFPDYSELSRREDIELLNFYDFLKRTNYDTTIISYYTHRNHNEIEQQLLYNNIDFYKVYTYNLDEEQLIINPKTLIEKYFLKWLCNACNIRLCYIVGCGLMRLPGEEFLGNRTSTYLDMDNYQEACKLAGNYAIYKTRTTERPTDFHYSVGDYIIAEKVFQDKKYAEECKEKIRQHKEQDIWTI